MREIKIYFNVKYYHFFFKFNALSFHYILYLMSSIDFWLHRLTIIKCIILDYPQLMIMLKVYYINIEGSLHRKFKIIISKLHFTGNKYFFYFFFNLNSSRKKMLIVFSFAKINVNKKCNFKLEYNCRMLTGDMTF